MASTPTILLKLLSLMLLNQINTFLSLPLTPCQCLQCLKIIPNVVEFFYINLSFSSYLSDQSYLCHLVGSSFIIWAGSGVPSWAFIFSLYIISSLYSLICSQGFVFVNLYLLDFYIYIRSLNFPPELLISVSNNLLINRTAL